MKSEKRKHTAWFGLVLLLIASASLVTRAQNQAPVLTPSREDRYTLHPGDVLDVQYRYTPEFNQTLTVQPDGYISLHRQGLIELGRVAVLNIQHVSGM